VAATGQGRRNAAPGSTGRLVLGDTGLTVLEAVRKTQSGRTKNGRIESAAEQSVIS
jgi:hypothetical protein